jgi:acetyl-CoA C-acetyltransferase
MSEAVIVSTARTPLAKSSRGSFNQTPGATLGGHTIRHAVQRAGLDPAEVEDVIMGCGTPEGDTGNNIARLCAVRAGLPISVGGTTVNCRCASGLQAISIAAQRVLVDKVPILVAGGVESISLVQPTLHQPKSVDPWLLEHKPELWMPMNETGDVVAIRYGISREVQDRYALLSQQRTAAAQQAGRFDEEIVPLTTTKLVTDKVTGETHEEEVTLSRDECNRPNTTLEGLLTEVYEFATRLAAGPPLVLKMIKQAVYESMRTDLRTSLDLISSHMVVVQSSHDGQEAMAAFREKRTPVFEER